MELSPTSPPRPHVESAAPGHAGVSALDLDNLVPGAKWRNESYLIGSVLPDITYGKVLQATHIPTGEAVLIRSFRVSDDCRERAWSRLSGYTSASLLRRIAADTADGRRIEITAAPEGKTLLEWFAGRTASPDDVRWILEQLWTALAEMHEHGVAHLNLKPTTIYVRSQNGVPTLTIGGLETLVDITRTELMSISVDPFYAPPEAIGLLQHYSGPAFLAWDWWTVGRVIQELVLGTHVLGLLIERDVSRHTPELLIRADQFLREKDIQKSRPGGVELMRGQSEAHLTLLRGLLASCRDARWSLGEVTLWLKGAKVKERYDLPRGARLFRWRGEAYALPEIAELLCEKDHWREAVDEVFALKRADSLFNFIQADGSNRTLAERCRELVELVTNSSLANMEPGAVREAITGLVLCLLRNGAAPLQIRGQAVDARFLRSVLENESDPSGLSLVESLCEPAVYQQVSHVDTTASRLLAEIFRLASTAIVLGCSHHWFSRADRIGICRLYFILLDEEATQEERLRTFREKYAVTRIEALNTLFQGQKLPASERSVVLFTLRDPEKFQYVTHELWQQEQHAHLLQRGESIARAITWRNFGALLRFGPHVLGSIVLVVAFWTMVAAAIALGHPSRLTLYSAIATMAVVLAVRFSMRGLALNTLRRRTSASPERFPNSQKCEEEAQRALANLPLVGTRQLLAELTQINRSIAELPGPAGRAVVAAPAAFWGTRSAVLSLTLFALAAVATMGIGAIRRPPQWEILKAAWLRPEVPERSAQVTTSASAAGAIPGLETATQPVAAESSEAGTGKAKVPADSAAKQGGTGKTRHAVTDTKMSWGFREPLEISVLKVVEMRDATPDQIASALEEGGSEVEPYIPGTISAPIAVHVSTDNGVGLMLFDGKAQKLTDRHVYMVSYLPIPRSWFLIGGKPVIYLGSN